MSFLKQAAAFSMILLTASAASAWEFNTCSGNEKIWNESPVEFSTDYDEIWPTSTWFTVIRGATLDWEESPGVGVNLSVDALPFISLSSGDDRNVIGFPNNYTWGTNTLATSVIRYQACIWPFWKGHIQEVDIFLNSAYPYNGNPSSSRPYDSAWMMSHEIGHALGLKNENDELSVMNSGFGVTGHSDLYIQELPFADDIAGIRAAYGTSGTARDLAVLWVRENGSFPTWVSNPTTVYRGNPASFSFTLSNRGTVNESSVRLEFYLDAEGDWDTHYLGSSMVSINQGISVTRNANVTIPASIPAGNYRFKVKVDPNNVIAEDSESNNTIQTGPINVPGNSPPNACFTVSSNSGSAPFSVSMNGACSSDPDGGTLSYTWNMGDGSSEKSGVSASHVYTSAGSYTLRLTVKDSTNLEDSVTELIWVSGDPCLTTGSDPVKALDPCMLSEGEVER